MTPNPARRAFLPQIELLRGLAALCVAFVHTVDVIVYAKQGSSYPLLKVAVGALNGYAAVILFFVISGFVLGLSLDRQNQTTSLWTYGRFVLQRFFRIYPAHFACLVIFVLLIVPLAFRLPIADMAEIQQRNPYEANWIIGTIFHVGRLFFLQNAALRYTTYNPVTWTLQVEVLAGLCVPFFFLLSRRRSWLLDAAVMASLVGVTFLWPIENQPGFFVFYLPAFYLGMLIATRGDALARLACRPLGANAALLASYAAMVLPMQWVKAGQLVPFWAVLVLSCAATSFLAIIVFRITVLTKFLEHPLLRWNGRVSFSFYLWHFLAAVTIAHFMYALIPFALLRGYVFVSFVVVLTATLSVAYAAAYLSYNWIERPFIVLGAKLLAWRWLAKPPVTGDG